MNGFDFFGLNHPTVVRMIEELPHVRACTGYQFDFDWVKIRIPKFLVQSLEGFVEEPPPNLPVNASGCARTEPILSRADLHSQKRQLYRRSAIQNAQSVTQVTPEEHLQPKQANGLPIAMQYRLLKQRKAKMVRMGRSPIHEWGVFATANMKESTLILEYVGEIIRQKVADHREKFYESKGRGCYMFRVDDDTVIDATCRGNITRFVNHCCEPNCIARIHTIEGKKHILLFTKRAIAVGEELTYDYMFSIEDDENKIPCCCGSVKCRGFMN